MPMTTSDARKRLAERKAADVIDFDEQEVSEAHDIEFLAAVFRVAWHAADAQGRTGERVESGLRAVLRAVEEIQ